MTPPQPIPEPLSQKPKAFAASLKTRLIAASLFLLVLSLGFNAMLTLSSLEKLYIESIVSKYVTTGKSLQRKLEGALGFGKNIEKFIGMEPLLGETRDFIIRTGSESAGQESGRSPDLSVSVSSVQGRVLYSTDPRLVGSTMDVDTGQKAYFRHGRFYVIPLPVYNSLDKSQAAHILISFHERHVTRVLASVISHNVKTILILLAVGFLILVLVFQASDFSILQQDGSIKLPRMKISILLFLVIGLSQVVFTSLNTLEFRNYYLDISRQKIAVLGSILKKDIDFLLSKGIRMDRLVKIEGMLKDIIVQAPELERIVIKDQDGRSLYRADKRDGSAGGEVRPDDDIPKDSRYSFHLEIVKDKKVAGEVTATVHQGSIATHISKEVLYAKLREIALDSLTVIVISFLFFLEMQIMIFNVFDPRPAGAEKKTSFMAVRITAFPLLIGGTISVSFLPLFMETLYVPLFGLSQNIVMGLPISVKLFFTGVAIVVSGAWCDRRGWHQPFLAGVLLTCAGNLYSWQARDALHFILAQGLSGMGYGLALMASQGFVVANTREDRRAQGLSNFFAGVYSGSICGIALGAMLAERIGYRPVFLIGSAVILLILPYYFGFMRNAEAKPPEKPAAEARPVLRFLFNRNILGLVLLSGIPAAVATIGFLNYFSPIYLKQIGASQSDIGRLFLVNGLCMVYIAPFMSRFIDRAAGKKMYVALSGLIGCAALVCFHYTAHTAGVFLTVLLLGLATAVNDPSRNSYLLKLQITRELGTGKALSISSSTYRIGQVLGPLTFGVLLSVSGPDGILYLGGLYLLITLLFLIVNQNDAHMTRTRTTRT